MLNVKFIKSVFYKWYNHHMHLHFLTKMKRGMYKCTSKPLFVTYLDSLINIYASFMVFWDKLVPEKAQTLGDKSVYFSVT